MTPAEYRQLAQDQEAASNAMLDGLDLTTVDAKLLLGLVGRMNIAVYRVAADLLDQNASAPSPDDARSDRISRLRRASIAGNEQSIRAIYDEMEEELLAKHARATEGPGNEAG